LAQAQVVLHGFPEYMFEFQVQKTTFDDGNTAQIPEDGKRYFKWFLK
jgi:hypothetical protein